MLRSLLPRWIWGKWWTPSFYSGVWDSWRQGEIPKSIIGWEPLLHIPEVSTHPGSLSSRRPPWPSRPPPPAFICHSPVSWALLHHRPVPTCPPIPPVLPWWVVCVLGGWEPGPAYWPSATPIAVALGQTLGLCLRTVRSAEGEPLWLQLPWRCPHTRAGLIFANPKWMFVSLCSQDPLSCSNGKPPPPLFLASQCPAQSWRVAGAWEMCVK